MPTHCSHTHKCAPEQDLPFSHISKADIGCPTIANMQVLVVDDDAPVRIGMQILLEAMGLRVALADSTEHAVALARTNHPQIVLADLRLRGDDDGLQTVRAIREFLPNTPSIIISGETAPDRLLEVQAAKLNLLHKPLKAALLVQSILEVLANASE